MSTSPQPDTYALELHRRAIIVDGHCDTPYRMRVLNVHIDEHHAEAQANLASLSDSGITASFFASYVPPVYADRGAAKYAFEQIDLIYAEAARRPDELEVITRSTDAGRVKREGKIGLYIGVEGGHAIEDSLETLRRLYDRGARYLTLTHVNTNNWADSSGDEPRHHGLTAFGRDVVRTMNDLGMLVDVSHVSDETFYDVLETTRVPVIASHSSCRALTNHPRNMTDEMLRDLAKNGGICMINFFSAFVNDGVAQTLLRAEKRDKSALPAGADAEIPDELVDWQHYLEWFQKLGCPEATIDDAVDHIVHAAEIAGIDHVGIGSDFDGVPSLPRGLSDASMLPSITELLVQRGMSDEDVLKILGGNFLRVFGQVESGRKDGW